MSSSAAPSLDGLLVVLPAGSTPCDLQARNLNRQGYGRTVVDGVTWYSHRLGWTRVHGPIPAGLTIDHVCMAPACRNVTHMQLTTPAQNSALQALRAARDTCPWGHPYAPRRGPSLRDCLTCLRLRNHRREDNPHRRPCPRCQRRVNLNPRSSRKLARHLDQEGRPCRVQS